ncbi:MAG: hypothetical protein M3Q29_24400 [Chloroflexota bacterium]|nr:hypothetical protein [Chloroflexota bacterium]
MSRYRLLLSLLVAVCHLALVSAHAYAQELKPTPPAAPSPPASPYSGAPEEPVPAEECGTFDVGCKLKASARDAFNDVLASLLETVTEQVRDFIRFSYEGPNNLLFRTPASLTYENPAVVDLWGQMRLLANAALVIIVLWGGFKIMVGANLGTPYHEAMELFPRVAVGALLVNTSDQWTQLLIVANNALCDGMNMGKMPGIDGTGTASAALVLLIALLVYTVMAFFLVLQSLLRTGLLAILIVLSPLAFACWILPETQDRARAWSSAYVAAVFTQFIQLVTLKLGAGIFIGQAVQPPTGPLAVPGQVMTAVIGCAVLYVTLKVPKLMRSHVDHPVSFLRFVAYQRAYKSLTGAGSGSAARGGSQAPAVPRVGKAV